MASWKIEPCSVADAPALAYNDMSAFWEDPTWILEVRHQNAVDPLTGELVGYAR
ncbi:hypothetical protein BDV38DRAFT_279659 [Aspergillus pseudotamarii]|uniref:N-acetyltransferase domain-containing protein n=1 Tax=Aspergillus pseudotamarii TaxID=132259 RepID=A0A5N6T2Z9_ASPPS|nr:uncharacterized protein BDV38DRAFT_279659 [Aspergillus pseudotamarii]KAE8140682.1 hypothetical protein BDV38DRAFT_279659 [Aspergillus pseudotamarii]